MRTAIITDQCPHWCAREHAAGTCGTAFYHASETSSVTISRPDGCSVPDRLDVQTAQYLPDDPGEPGLVTYGRDRGARRRPLPADRADTGRSQGPRGSAGPGRDLVSR